MFTRSIGVNGELSQSRKPAKLELAVQPKRRLWLIGLAGLLSFGLTLLMLGIVSAARMETMPQFVDLPQYYLPGNPVPKEVSCTTQMYEYLDRCFIEFGGHDVYFSFDANRKTIIRTLIPARAYTIGQLILFWGKPSGIDWKDTMIYFYWGTRSALLYTRSLRPDNRVEFILYDLEQQTASPWRGFRLYKD